MTKIMRPAGHSPETFDYRHKRLPAERPSTPSPFVEIPTTAEQWRSYRDPERQVVLDWMRHVDAGRIGEKVNMEGVRVLDGFTSASTDGK